MADCEFGLLSPGPRSWERLQPVIKSLFEAPLSLARNFLNFSTLGCKRKKTQSPSPPPQQGPQPSPGAASRWWGLHSGHEGDLYPVDPLHSPLPFTHWAVL